MTSNECYKLAAETKRADEAEAACAAMPRVVIDFIRSLGGTDKWINDAICRALQDKLGAPATQEEALREMFKDAGRAILERLRAAEAREGRIRVLCSGCGGCGHPVAGVYIPSPTCGLCGGEGAVYVDGEQELNAERTAHAATRAELVRLAAMRGMLTSIRTQADHYAQKSDDRTAGNVLRDIAERADSALSTDAGKPIIERLRVAEDDAREWKKCALIDRNSWRHAEEERDQEREAHATTRALLAGARYCTDEARAALAKAEEERDRWKSEAAHLLETRTNVGDHLQVSRDAQRTLQAALGHAVVVLRKYPEYGRAWVDSMSETSLSQAKRGADNVRALDAEFDAILADPTSAQALEAWRELEAVYEAAKKQRNVELAECLHDIGDAPFCAACVEIVNASCEDLDVTIAMVDARRGAK